MDDDEEVSADNVSFVVLSGAVELVSKDVRDALRDAGFEVSLPSRCARRRSDTLRAPLLREAREERCAGAGGRRLVHRVVHSALFLIRCERVWAGDEGQGEGATESPACPLLIVLVHFCASTAYPGCWCRAAHCTNRVCRGSVLTRWLRVLGNRCWR
jgi:hypothetical protein